jgi:hypothetical protein
MSSCSFITPETTLPEQKLLNVGRRTLLSVAVLGTRPFLQGGEENRGAMLIGRGLRYDNAGFTAFIDLGQQMDTLGWGCCKMKSWKGGGCEGGGNRPHKQWLYAWWCQQHGRPGTTSQHNGGLLSSCVLGTGGAQWNWLCSLKQGHCPPRKIFLNM